MPSYVRQARADSPWPRLLAALVRGCLLITIVLCAFAHGPVDEPHRTPTQPSTVLTAMPPSSGHETPHGTARQLGGAAGRPGLRAPP
ncbi:hypothetical protein [Streptomyces ossamyceticus]|uniref:Secreted protein n=1 Tax=Streptomyces ossamyceticus TaxID=249581 RepID=A0ABV2V8J2_9ACTN